MRKPIVHLYTVCWNEADMLGFFFRHYDPWVDRYVVYDDGSTDGSREILRAHPKVELRDFVRSDAASFVLSHREIQNEVWKESRGTGDWIVVTAIDEHLHVPGQEMAHYLAEQTDRGVTLIPALGFDLNHPEMQMTLASLLNGSHVGGLASHSTSSACSNLRRCVRLVSVLAAMLLSRKAISCCPPAMP